MKKIILITVLLFIVCLNTFAQSFYVEQQTPSEGKTSGRDVKQLLLDIEKLAPQKELIDSIAARQLQLDSQINELRILVKKNTRQLNVRIAAQEQGVRNSGSLISSTNTKVFQLENKFTDIKEDFSKISTETDSLSVWFIRTQAKIKIVELNLDEMVSIMKPIPIIVLVLVICFVMFAIFVYWQIDKVRSSVQELVADYEQRTPPPAGNDDEQHQNVAQENGASEEVAYQEVSTKKPWWKRIF